MLCLVACFPTAALWLPWFPANVVALVQTYGQVFEQQHYDTGAFARRHVAVGLYLAGLASVYMLLKIWTSPALFGVRESRCWILPMVTGISIAIFFERNIGPGTDSFAVLASQGLPFAISVLSAVGLTASVLRPKLVGETVQQSDRADGTETSGEF